MFIQISDNKLLFDPDENTVIRQKAKVWFKGYFFINNIFYIGVDAGNFFLEAWMSSKIDKTVQFCNGIFTCVIVSSDSSEIVVLNDRFGFGHLFYVFENKNIFISDNFWLLKNKCNKNQLNSQAMFELLATRYVFYDGTLVDGIKTFLPASVYTIHSDTGFISLERKEYWFFGYSPTEITGEDAEMKLLSVLNRIIKRYRDTTIKNTVTGLNLTGGLDSRFLLGLLINNDIKSENIRAYTFGKKSCDDIRYGRLVASFAGIEYKPAIFDENFSDFFNPETVDEILEDIGFSTYYFQGYGIKKLLPEYGNIDYLLTGSDGFFVGLMANTELFSLKNEDELINYIFKKNATILNQKECDFILKKPLDLQQNIKNRIAHTLPENCPDMISGYYDWTIKNRLRKYILSIYELLNRKTCALFPFYDYEFIDLMATLPYHLLSGQKIYFNAMFKHTFSGKLNKLKTIPVEFREKIIQKGNDFPVNFKRYGILYRIIKKMLALPERFYPYPIFSFFRRSPANFLRLIESLTGNASEFIENSNVILMVQKNRHREYFFRYGLLVIISILRFEQLIKKRIE